MIPVRRVRKPAGFDTNVGKPGKQWLQAHPKARRPEALGRPISGVWRAALVTDAGMLRCSIPRGGPWTTI